MKKLLLASCTFLALAMAGPRAMASDLGLAGASYDWSGGYLGINTGAAVNSSSLKSDYRYTGTTDIGSEALDLIDSLDSSNTADDLSLTGGMLAGYNWQYSSFVFGAEADFNYLGFSGSVKADASDVMSQVMAPENTDAAEKINYSADWFGTVRARMGYAMDNLLIYGTGGIAYGKMKVKQQLEAFNDAGESAIWQSSDEGWNAGWTLGGGIEYAAGRWLLGAEYLYVDLGTYSWGSNGDVELADPTLMEDWSQVKEKGEADFTFSVARATLKYRF